MQNNRQIGKMQNIRIGSLATEYRLVAIVEYLALKTVLQKNQGVQVCIFAEVQFCKKYSFSFVSLNLKKNIVSLSG